MVLRQTTLQRWRHPYQRQPGRDGVGSLASSGPIQATGASVNFQVRGRQSTATDPQEKKLSLRIAQWNCEGLQRKKPELQNFLHKNNVDVVCIQETMLTENQRFFMRGFEIFRHDRKERHKGGIITLVRNSIPAVEIQHFERGDLEHQTVKILLPEGDMLVTNIYSPPSTPLNLECIQLTKTKHLIVGDFNSHSPSWGYSTMDPRGEEVEDWMAENQLILINKPDDDATFFSRAWKTISSPDIAMATDDIQGLTERSVHPQLGGSDHLPIILDISTKSCQGHNMRPSWNLKQAKWNLYSHRVDELTSEISEENNLNKNVDLFTAAILQAAKETIPRGKRWNYKPYWSKEVQALHSELSNARKEMEQNPTPEVISKHNKIKEDFNKQKTTELRKSWAEKTSTIDAEKNSKKLWGLITSLNEDKKRSYSKTVLEENGKHCSGKQAANILADMYQEESKTNIEHLRQKDVREETKEQLRQRKSATIITTPLTGAELNAAISKLKMKKAPGKDGILNDMLKHLGRISRQKLLLIYNQSWSKGKFPDSWREAIIVPILKKKKDKTKKSSYRPVSLLSCIGKLLERMVNWRLLKHLEENLLLNNSQSAYRKNRSTEDQLVYLSQELENAYQEKKKTLAVFVDLTKAFDKVWKEGLLLKLLRKKVDRQMFLWIKDFLQHRTARLKLDGHTSHQIHLQQGVPQGGVISTTLFLVFIDDITDGLSRHISRAIHADDLAIWNSEENLSTATYRMQEALNIVTTWARDWGVVINETKTVASIFSLSTRQETANLQLNGKKLSMEDSPMYLGVKLDKRLTWNPQIQNMEDRATKRLALMKKLAGTTWGADSSILRKVYIGAVRPIMEYGNTVWATAAKSNMTRLNKVQNAGLRLITGALKTTPIEEMERYSNIRPLENRRQEKVLAHSEKLRRLQSHHMSKKLQQPTSTRLKRTSFKQMSKALAGTFEDLLPANQEDIEPLQLGEFTSLPEEVTVSLSVHGIDLKKDLHPHELKALTLNMIDEEYSPEKWTHVYTDGSAEEAIKNGGAGFVVYLTNGKSMSDAVPTGKASSNFRAEAEALKCATELLIGMEVAMPYIVIFTDCRSLLQALHKPSSERQTTDIHNNLRILSSKSSVCLQWIPAHSGIQGNEKADKLSKDASKMPQPSHPITYNEAKTIIRNKFHSKWKEENCTLFTEKDPIHKLPRRHQTTIFRLRTGHCRLLGHLFRLRVSHTDECPCGTGPQSVEHVLQHCPSHQTLRLEAWPTSLDLRQKLWGTLQDLQTTADFIHSTEILV